MHGIIGVSVSVIAFIGILIKNINSNKKYNDAKEEERKQRKNITDKIQYVEEEIHKKEEMIKELEEINDRKSKGLKEEIIKKYGNCLVNINEKIDRSSIIEEQNYINERKLAISKEELGKQALIEKIEKLSEVEENLTINEETLSELLEYSEAINIAKEALDNAYSEMKESVTPKFTQNLSDSIKSITNGKYSNVKVNEENELSLETKNGNYVQAYVLSDGTIDQLYLSLRISSIDELTKENMPIILDETFAYFDKKRLENVLSFLNENYKNKQIIILTCTDRELQVLNNQNEISYNLIDLH